MKTKVKTNKLPRAKIMQYMHDPRANVGPDMFVAHCPFTILNDGHQVTGPCLVLPQPSLSAAKKALKWAKLGEEEASDNKRLGELLSFYDAMLIYLVKNRVTECFDKSGQRHTVKQMIAARAEFQLLGKGANSK